MEQQKQTETEQPKTETTVKENENAPFHANKPKFTPAKTTGKII
jgi:hypothetical protein